MAEGKDRNEDQQENPSHAEMRMLIDEAMKFIRAALVEGRPKGIVWKAKRLYEVSGDSRNKSKATEAALLSNWPVFWEYLTKDRPETESLSKEEIAALFIHHTFKRSRRNVYRDKQIKEQVARANVPGKNGEPEPFNPKGRKAWEESLKNLREEIDLILGKRSVRDRMVLEMKYFGELVPAAIVQEICMLLPGEPISKATISRIVARFRDELRDRLKDD